jgi:hypothetical protein
MEASGQLHTTAGLSLGKQLLARPFVRKLGGPQSRSGRGGEEKNPQSLQRLEPPIIQSVAQRYNTELFRLLTSLLSII